MKFEKLSLVVAASVLLVACGGGGNAGTSPFGGGASSGGGTDGGTATNASGSVVLALSSNTVNASQPATVTAVVKNAEGQPVSGALVTFEVSGASASIAQLGQLTSITNSKGEASTTLGPAPGATSGAAYVTASADVGGASLTTKQAFSLTASSVTLGAVTLTASEISGYGSVGINVAVAEASSSNPVQVEFSSTCAAANKATISPSVLTLTTTSGSVTYQDNGCASTDRINVQIAGTSQKASRDLVVTAPPTQGLQYVSVDTPTICLKGTGCPSVANVKFKVVDSAGLGKAGVVVDFELDSSVANFATLGSQFGTTDNSGAVAVAVASKTTPTPLRVTAKVRGSSPTIQTVSNLLTISGGLPVAGLTDSTTGISFAAEKYALDASLDGDESALTIRLRDQWGAPAVDGTAVTFVSDGGTVAPSSCSTSAGSCSVKLKVSNPKPINGRVHVVAFAKGQEYFIDLDSNSEFSGSDTYDDVPAGVCVNTNENNTCDPGEFVIGNSLAPDAGNAAWDGSGTAYARKSRTLFFSLTQAAPRLYKTDGSGRCTDSPVDASYMTVVMGTSSREFVEFCIRDANTNADTPFHGNPIMSGSILAVESTTSAVTASVDNSPVPATVSGPTRHVISVKNASAPTPITAGGSIDLKITMGGKTITLLDAVTVTP